MPLETFLSSVGLILLTELGDKTMITAMCLSAQYRRPGIVLAATMLALATSSVIAVVVGIILAGALPVDLIVYVSAFLFIGLGLYTLARSDSEEVDTCDNPGTLLSMFSLVFFSELGDKSQITILALVVQSAFPVSVFLGAVVGFFTVNAVGVLAGDRISGHIPIKIVKRVAGIVFVLFGILVLFSVL
jgi:putative Ca2+/H+ antiporter (TMEM165/GDT1 family)